MSAACRESSVSLHLVAGEGLLNDLGRSVDRGEGSYVGVVCWE